MGRNFVLKISFTEVVIIIATIIILASIAIPQYEVYALKSRQKESFHLLTAYYAAAQSSYTEMNVYPGNFVSMGFSPEGVIHYRVTSADNSSPIPLGLKEDARCISTMPSVTCEGFKTWVEDAKTPYFHTAAPVSIPLISDDFFSAVASAIIKQDGTLDEWTINQAKIMTNTISGL